MSALDLQIAEIAAGQHGVIALRQLRDLGASERAARRRLADRRLYPLFRGVFVVGRSHPALHGRWRGATLALGDDALLSHRDAAVLHELASERRPSVDVTVPGRNARPQRGIRPHRIVAVDPRDRTTIDGIPVTSLARTLLDLAGILDPTRLRRAYEQAERHRALDLVAIRELLARANGHRGTAKLRALLAYDPTLAAQAASELERIFLDLLREAGLPMPLVNVLVDGYLVDAYWPQANLVVELDGYEFHRDREVFERDRRKIAELRLAGREVLPLTHRQVTREPQWVIAAVAEQLSRGAATLRPDTSL